MRLSQTKPSPDWKGGGAVAIAMEGDWGPRNPGKRVEIAWSDRAVGPGTVKRGGMLQKRRKFKILLIREWEMQKKARNNIEFGCIIRFKKSAWS